MSSSDPAHNLRKSVRCAVDNTRRQCLLVVGKKNFPVLLNDESTGGFAVLIEGLPGLRPGDIAQLHTDHGLFDVRLVRIVRAESPWGDNSANSDEPSTWHLLGLCRVGEALPLSPKTASVFSESYRLYRAPGTTSSGMWITIGLILVLLTIAISLGITFFSQRSKPWKPKISTSPTTSNEAKINNQLYETIRRSPGATAFVLPDVSKELNLTNDQIENIRRLIDDLSKAMHLLNEEAPSKGMSRGQLAQIRNQWQQENRNKAIQILTPEQREKWKELNAKP